MSRAAPSPSTAATASAVAGRATHSEATGGGGGGGGEPVSGETTRRPSVVIGRRGDEAQVQELLKFGAITKLRANRLKRQRKAKAASSQHDAMVAHFNLRHLEDEDEPELRMKGGTSSSSSTSLHHHHLLQYAKKGLGTGGRKDGTRGGADGTRCGGSGGDSGAASSSSSSLSSSSFGPGGGDDDGGWWRCGGSVVHAFDPSAPWRRAWDLTLAIAVGFEAAYIPYVLCFRPATAFGAHLMELAIDAFFTVDLLFNFNLAYFYENADDSAAGASAAGAGGGATNHTAGEHGPGGATTAFRASVAGSGSAEMTLVRDRLRIAKRCVAS